MAAGPGVPPVVFQRAGRGVYSRCDLVWLVGERGGVQLEGRVDQRMSSWLVSGAVGRSGRWRRRRRGRTGPSRSGHRFAVRCGLSWARLVLQVDDPGVARSDPRSRPCWCLRRRRGRPGVEQGRVKPPVAAPRSSATAPLVSTSKTVRARASRSFPQGRGWRIGMAASAAPASVGGCGEPVDQVLASLIEPGGIVQRGSGAGAGEQRDDGVRRAGRWRASPCLGPKEGTSGQGGHRTKRSGQPSPAHAKTPPRTAAAWSTQR